MREQYAPSPSATILLVGAVVATVLGGLLLAVADSWQLRLPSPPTPMVVAVATTAVPPTVSLPTVTPSPTTVPATATPRGKPTTTPVPVLDACGTVPSGWVAYTVRRGDTLVRLGLDSGATVAAIMVANCLDSDRIYAGMRLYLPSTPPPPPPPCTGPPPSWQRYMVQRGDTLFSLARHAGVTLSRLMSANCLVSTKIKAGSVLYLPPGAGPTATATSPPPPPPPATPTRSAPTATATATASPEPVTVTATSSPVASPTATATALVVPPTATASATGTATATAASSPTPTATPTATPTTPPPPLDTPTATSTVPILLTVTPTAPPME